MTEADLLNISLGFIEGFALIISPCILPILPIIFAGSLTGSKQRPVGIIVGFILVFSLFTLFSRYLVQRIGIDLNLVRHISFIILLLLGIIMMSTWLTEKFSHLTQRLANTGSSLSLINNPQGGWLSGVLFGGLVSIIWTPCAGPILAAIIVQTVFQQTGIISFLTLIAFAAGAATPMFIIAIFGREMMSKLDLFKKHTNLFRKILGAIIILSVAYMIYAEKNSGIANAETNRQQITQTLQDGLWRPYPAPEIAGIDAWINSNPLSINELKGKVVLIDFWTYSCINCMRTLPYLNDWYNKYHEKGLVIIGVHSPEFDFEKNLDNVENAVKNDGIKYPVALDNHFSTWRNYNNRYWPAHYLIDKNGYVVYTHFGEGDYKITENNIRYLLGVNDIPEKKLAETQDISFNQTPETYFGYARSEYFSNPSSDGNNQSVHYTFPPNLKLHYWALQGEWKILSDRIISTQDNASLKIHFHAQNVYVVMGSAYGNDINVTVLLNGKPLTENHGKNIKNSSMTVNRHSLYHVIAFKVANDATLEITAATKGLEIYTFTFG